MKSALQQSLAWKQILAAHAARQTTPPRLVVDEDFLSRWEQGQLTEKEHRELLEELSVSAESRQIVQTLTEAGALRLPESLRDDEPILLVQNDQPTVISAGEDTIVKELPRPPVFVSSPASEAESSTAVRPLRRSPAWQNVGWMVLCGIAIAATALMLIPPRNNMLQVAQQALQASNYEQAFQSAEQVLMDVSAPEQRQQAWDVFCQSGEHLAADALASRRFDDVRLISNRMDQQTRETDTLSATSREIMARIESMRLQARRGIEHPLALDQFDRLSDYVHSMPFTAPFLDMFPFPGNVDQRIGPEELHTIQEEYQDALSKYPWSPELRLNFGQFLLERGRAEDALQQFQMILDGDETFGLPRDEENRYALLGKALALFHRGQFQESHDLLKRLQSMFPDDEHIHENAAGVLETIQKLIESVSRPIYPGLWLTSESVPDHLC